MVIAFLTRFVTEVTIQNFSKAQALITLPLFHTRFFKRQYKAGTEVLSLEEGGVFGWPDVMQYLLRNYVQLSRLVQQFSTSELYDEVL